VPRCANERQDGFVQYKESEKTYSFHFKIERTDQGGKTVSILPCSQTADSQVFSLAGSGVHICRSSIGGSDRFGLRWTPETKFLDTCGVQINFGVFVLVGFRVGRAAEI
jgi:hypothetical protein